MQSTAELLCHPALAVLISEVRNGGERQEVRKEMEAIMDVCDGSCGGSSVSTKSPVRKLGEAYFDVLPTFSFLYNLGPQPVCGSVHICGEESSLSG